MKIAKLFNNPYKSNENFLVLKTVDGEYKCFTISPYRKITENDLHDYTHYKEYRNNKAEAPNYLYRMYGFEKCTK